MVTIRLSGTDEAEVVSRVGALLRSGGVAALPAEGVYGLHALASDRDAVARVRRLKGSAERRGFIGLLAAPEDLARWTEPDPVALALASEYWPGALTLVARPSPVVPDALRSEDGTVALRCPGSSLLRAIVAAAQGLVISTSANRPGLPPALRGQEVLSTWADLLVDAGPLSGTPSTVVRVEGGRRIVLREGSVRLREATLDDGPGAA